MQIECGTALIEHVWKTFKVNKSTLLELSFTKTNDITREHFKENDIWIIYQLNAFNSLLFLYRIKNEKEPNVFIFKILRSMHHYPTSFSQNNCFVPSFKLTGSKYRITIRAPILWNVILNIEEKLIGKPAI